MSPAETAAIATDAGRHVEELRAAARRLWPDRDDAAVMSELVSVLGELRVAEDAIDGARTPADVARWMFDELSREGFLGQATAAVEIAHRFGQQFVYENARGRPAIAHDVLVAFKALSGDVVVWCRRGRFWRPRRPEDSPGRLQP